MIDLKIKITNISKVQTDLEMENIMGTLDDKTYEDKISRLKTMEERLKNQVVELEKLF